MRSIIFALGLCLAASVGCDPCENPVVVCAECGLAGGCASSARTEVCVDEPCSDTDDCGSGGYCMNGGCQPFYCL